ncbi:MAG: SMC-Scp complex subunit ScpB [Thermoguttaceae bacterium]
MSEAQEPRSDISRPEGISLDELTQAFAQVMGTAPKLQGKQEESATLSDAIDHASPEVLKTAEELPPADKPSGVETAADPCELSPRSIFEAMLFVGNCENKPLSAVKAAELMRDVTPEEIHAIVEDLNKIYQAGNRPYHIVNEGEGYSLKLKKSYSSLQNKLHGRMRETRLSQAAVDVLAIVAYQQPLSCEQVTQMRGKPSSHILNNLVRFGLLRIERSATKPRKRFYYTTDRFLRLFNLQTLGDLPQSEDAAK